MEPFHLSLVVLSLEKIKSFYIELLACELGRDTDARKRGLEKEGLEKEGLEQKEQRIRAQLLARL